MTTTLITGATSGIGLELANLYTQQNHRVLRVGRKSLADLEHLNLSPDDYIQTDLAQPEAAQQVSDFLAQHNITQIDQLILNAGIGYYGRIEDQSAENIAEVTAVNLRAPIALTYHLLPLLKTSKGRVVFISSVAAALPTADYTVYAATKAALDGFAKNLRIELGDAARVQVIHPGATQTDMHRKVGITPDVMDTSKFPSAESVSRKIAGAIKSNAYQTTIGFSNKMLRLAGTQSPRLIDSLMKGSASQ